MQPSAISNPTTTAATGAIPGARRTDTKPGQQVDYMKLIVAQMRNLNPMDPSSGGDSLPTMMQAESLNQLTKLNQALTDLQAMTQTGYAASLIGRTVSGVDAANKPVSGAVRGLHIGAGGPSLVLADGRRVRMLDITEVSG